MSLLHKLSRKLIGGDNFKTFSWDEEGQKEYEQWRKPRPLRYKIGRWIEHVEHIMRDMKWWVFHRFHPKHRYHVIRTGLKPGWRDRSDLIPYMMIKMFNDFVEKEKPFEHFVTEGPDANDPEGWTRVKMLYEKTKSLDVFDVVDQHEKEFAPHLFGDKITSDELTEILIELVRLRGFYWT